MKRQLNLVLIELAVMLLVAAAASAVCLSAFSMARDISLSNTRRDSAYIEMQNMAELFKHCSGDISEVAKKYGATCTRELTVELDGVTVRLTVKESGELWIKGELVAEDSHGRTVGRLEVVAQREVSDHD